MGSVQNSCLNENLLLEKYKTARHRLMKLQLKQFEYLIKQQVLKNNLTSDIITNNKNIQYLCDKQEEAILHCQENYKQPITQCKKPNRAFISFSQPIVEHFIEQESKKHSALMRELNDFMKTNPNDPNLKLLETSIYKEIVYQYEEEIIDLHSFLMQKYHDFDATFSSEPPPNCIDVVDLSLGAFMETIIRTEDEAKVLFGEDKNNPHSSMLNSYFARKIYNFILDMLSLHLSNENFLGPDGSENQKINIITDNGQIIKKITTSYKDAVWTTCKNCRQELFALIRNQIEQKRELCNKDAPQLELDLKFRSLIRIHTKELNDKYSELEYRINKIGEKNRSNTNIIETRAIDKTGNHQVTTTDIVANMPNHDDIITLKFNCIRQAFIQEFINLEGEVSNFECDGAKQTEFLNKYFYKKLVDAETNYLKALGDHKPVSDKNSSHIPNRILSEITIHKADGSIMIKKQQVIPKLPAEAGEGNIIEFLAGQSLTNSLSQLKNVMRKNPSHIHFQDSIIVDDESVNGKIDLNGTLNFSV